MLSPSVFTKASKDLRTKSVNWYYIRTLNHSYSRSPKLLTVHQPCSQFYCLQKTLFQWRNRWVTEGHQNGSTPPSVAGFHLVLAAVTGPWRRWQSEASKKESWKRPTCTRACPTQLGAKGAAKTSPARPETPGLGSLCCKGAIVVKSIGTF